MVSARAPPTATQRTLLDNNYYLHELNNRIKLLQDEIGTMNKETAELDTNINAYSALQRKYEQLNGEVKDMQGQLADYNLMVDKMRMEADPEEVELEYKHLARQNEAENSKVDAVFTERTSLEDELKQVQASIEQIHAEEQESVSGLPEERRSQYAAMSQDNNVYIAQISEKETELSEWNEKGRLAEEALSKEPLKQQASFLLEQKRQLMKKRNEMEAEDSKQRQLSVPEEKEQLRKEAQEGAAEIQFLDRQSRELQSQIKMYKEQMAQLDDELSDYTEERVRNWKEMQAHDRGLQAKIDSFEEQQAAGRKALADAQEVIVSLLQSISKGLKHESSMPSSEGYEKARTQLDLKSRTKMESEATSEMVMEELSQRKAELEKINSLDERITAEMAHLKSQTQEHKRELEAMHDLDALKEEFEQKRMRLVARREKIEERRSALRQRVQLAHHENKKRFEKLQADDTASVLDKLEHSIRHKEQLNFATREMVDAKLRESDYASISVDVRRQVDELNGMLIRGLGF